MLRNAVRPYAWGSRTAIAELLGREVPSPHPEAELWMGAHPNQPSWVLDSDGTEESLLAVLEADPEGQLGAEVAKRWGNRLPFLLKVLAADESLSLQAHPSAAQAVEGYEREEQAGIPRDAAYRNYPDPMAKPELICALTEFHALAGFAAAERTITLLKELNVPELLNYVALLSESPNADGVRALFTTLITLPQQTLDHLFPRLLDACVAHVKEHGQFELECRTVLELGEAYPGDPGVLASLLLNRIVLRPGEALYFPAGNPHAYLRGTGVEILANSDNVLRCGMTPKHVDVPELLRVLDFSGAEMPIRQGESADGQVFVYPTPAAEFELSRIEWQDTVNSIELTQRGPRILLCTKGSVLVAGEDGVKLRLAKGQSAWLPASESDVSVTPDCEGPVQLFLAATGK